MTAQNLAADVLEELGFGGLGFYSLSVLYFAFALSCFIATPIVNKCGERFSMTTGALCFWLYVSSFLLPSASIKYPDVEIDKALIEAVILVAAAFNGFGAALLWVSKGRYISRIANEENKGTFISIFWAVYMACAIVGVLFGAIVLKNTDAFTFYISNSTICLLAALFFLFLPPVDKLSPDDNSDDHYVQTQETNQNEQGTNQ